MSGVWGYAIFALDTRGFVTSWNEHAEKVSGYLGEEIIGRHFSVFYPHEQVVEGRPQRELDEAAKAGFHMEEGWRLRKDGSRFWANVTITTQRANDGSLHGFIVMSRDETEARTRHRRSSRRFTDLFDLAPVGIGLFDEHDYILHANNALCDLLGFQLEELHGKPGTALLHPDDRGSGITPHPTGADAAEGPPAAQQRMLARADGRPVICNVHSAVSMEDSGIHFWQVVFQDVTEQHHRAEMLHHRATHDELTGLLNRAGVHEYLERLLEEHRPDRVAVLFCDLDNFKRVNDSLGHEAGDELLVALARQLNTGLPEVCTAARMFGDEFLIICSDLAAVGGLNKLTALVSGLLDTVVPVQDQTVWLSASIGAAVVEGANTTSQDLVRFSDAAMFRAKARSPGSVVVATEELLSPTSTRQVQVEGLLREAIRNDELTIRYQPIVDRDGSIVMAEALMRWSHPHLGMVAPDFILPVAQRGNLLRELDRSVLRTALREAATWPLVGGKPVQISINLSGLLPDSPNFADEIVELVEGSGNDWERVVLEVVETSLSALSTQSRENMIGLVERGLRFAVDDFGTAYSSLQRLKDLPAQIIKIDRGFVTGAEQNPVDRAIVQAIVDMSRGLRCRCIAEGVETASQLHLLQELGAHLCQGFLFSPAMQAADFRALLERGGLQMPGDRSLRT